MTGSTIFYFRYDISRARHAYEKALASTDREPASERLKAFPPGDGLDTPGYSEACTLLNLGSTGPNPCTDLRAMEQATDFDTRAFLAAALFSLAPGREPTRPPWVETVLVSLLHKFEVFGRLYDRHGSDLRKRGHRFDDPEVYALFSLALLACFDASEDPAWLNTALKVNDVITLLPADQLTSTAVALGLAALAAGEARLEQWYDGLGFVLPAD